MNSTGCISLAGSLLKTRGTPGFFGQLVRQPFLQLNREYHDPCEPLHLSWQWRVKDSPDVQRCSKLCLRKKACPKKRFLPRFKKSFIYHDIFACDPPKEKPKSWGEYLSFLLPDDITSKPQMATCRKMLEHRRRKCMDVDDYSKCVKGECWPLPTEWYGQGVLHISELALTRPPYKPVESVKPCPPAANTISSCVMKKLPKCPTTLLCLEDTPRKMPYSQFKGADTDGGPPSITLKCPIKYVPEMLPDKHQSRHYKLSCKTYGDYKSVECPPQMFNRYMDVDFSSKNLLPIPTTMPGYTPQREVKKGVCGRQTLLRPPSARNFSTGRTLMVNDFPEFIKIVNTTHLQPGRSPICFDKLVERAGMNAELLNKPLVERQFDSSQRQRLFTEKELEKHEAEARIAEETPQERKKRLDAKKSKLQMLIEKQEKESKKQDAGETVKSVGNLLSGSQNQPFGGRLVDLEEVPYQRSKFHSSATRYARKGNEKKSSGSAPEEEKICSGCPGIRGAQDPKTKGKSKCAISRGGAKGRCRVNRAIRPEDRLSPLSIKCKGVSDSPCMRQRCETCLVGVATRFIHLTQIPSQPLKERIVFPMNTFLINRDVKVSYSQQSKDLLDQCCDQLEQLKKQIETMKASKGQSKDEAKEMLDQCCEQMEQLKQQLAALKKDKGSIKSDPMSKDLLDQCCEQQEQLKKQIEGFKKSKGGKKKDPCEDENKKGGSNEKVKTQNEDPCEKKGGGEGKKTEKSYDPCRKPEQTGINCKKIKDKKEKAEECAKYLTKQNENLKKQLEELKKKQGQQSAKVDKKKDKSKNADPCANRKDTTKDDDCKQLKEDKRKAEEKVKSLINENEKIKQEMANIKKQLGKSGEKKKPKVDVCAPKSKAKEPEKPQVDKDLQKALDECMKKCSRKAEKMQIKKKVKAEKEKCKEQVEKKKRELMSKHGQDEDGNAVATFLQSVCCKLQELAKKKKKKPKC